MLGLNVKRGVSTTLERVFTAAGYEFGNLEVLWSGSTAGIIFERNDPVLTVDNHALWLQSAFRAHHYRSRLKMLDIGSTHFDILDTDTTLGRTLVDFAWSVVRRTQPR